MSQISLIDGHDDAVKCEPMREKLIELIAEGEETMLIRLRGMNGKAILKRDAFGWLADHLFANGVIVLPCKVGTHLWRVTHPYRQEPKVTEFVVKNFRTVGKKHKVQIEVQAVNTPGTNWMRFCDFKTTREEAEAALRKEDEGK